MMFRFLILLVLSFVSLEGRERSSSYPYLAGDTWRFACKWVLSYQSSFDPNSVESGDTIFVEHDSLESFRTDYLPQIQNPFILVTANSEQGGDDPLPARHRELLDHPLVYRWLLQNIDCEPGEKMIPIPIGLANKGWDHGDISYMNKYIPIAMEAETKLRPILAYLNFNTSTNPSVRGPCRKYFEGKPYCYIANPTNYASYLNDLSDSVFVVSPPGGGVDCHRTWEALLMGCYPIVKRTTLCPLYEGLPVVVVDSWEEVTEEFLLAKAEEFATKEWSRERLYAPYWFDLVAKLQEEIAQGGNAHFIRRKLHSPPTYSYAEGAEFLEASRKLLPTIDRYLPGYQELAFQQSLDVQFYDRIGFFSPLVLKYIKVACELVDAYGEDLKTMKIVEVAGYDGILCKILNDLTGFKSYTFVDSIESLDVKKMFLDQYELPNLRFEEGLQSIESEEFDLAISLYGYGEIDSQNQHNIVQSIFKRSSHGLVVCSFAPRKGAVTGENLVRVLLESSRKGDLQIENSSKQDYQTKQPLSMQKSKVVRWRPNDEEVATLYKHPYELFDRTRLHPDSAVTSTYSGGRLGDNLIAYLHSRWVAQKYGLQLLHNPFPFSDRFKLSSEIPLYNPSASYDQVIVVNNESQILQAQGKTLFIIPYYPECLDEHMHPHFEHLLRLTVNRDDPDFRPGMVQSLSLKSPYPTMELPEDAVTVALHVRRGGAHDDYSRHRFIIPVKHPSDEFYLDALRTIMDIYPNKKIYAHIFTDDLNPDVILHHYQDEIRSDRVSFGLYYSENYSSAEHQMMFDMYSMANFDCIVRAQSNFSIISEYYGHPEIVIYPIGFHVENGWPIFHQIEIRFKRKIR